ncbi:hypothetical protein CPB85DRAFT_628928 [Mucidula mucida]|nr:hypothetical protein CPB85DRAFT_628928 [Mucidula mucida]
MAPGRPVRGVRVSVPRHNAQDLGSKMTAEVQNAAKEKGVRVDLSRPGSSSDSGLAESIESASEWNSFLMTARASRGPQWDIGTQQFHVDEHSNLYYDPTVLVRFTRRKTTPPPPPPQPPSHPHSLPSHQSHHPSHHHSGSSPHSSSRGYAQQPQRGPPQQVNYPYPGRGGPPPGFPRSGGPMGMPGGAMGMGMGMGRGEMMGMGRPPDLDGMGMGPDMTRGGMGGMGMGGGMGGAGLPNMGGGMGGGMPGGMGGMGGGMGGMGSPGMGPMDPRYSGMH